MSMFLSFSLNLFPFALPVRLWAHLNILLFTFALTNLSLCFVLVRGDYTELHRLLSRQALQRLFPLCLFMFSFEREIILLSKHLVSLFFSLSVTCLFRAEVFGSHCTKLVILEVFVKLAMYLFCENIHLIKEFHFQLCLLFHYSLPMICSFRQTLWHVCVLPLFLSKLDFLSSLKADG